MTWPMVKLGELVSVKGGKRLPKGAEYSTEVTKHPYIRVCDMGLGELKTPDSDLKYISDEVFDSIKRYTISSEDVYISIAGTIGVVGCIPKRLSGANLTENAAKLVIKDSDKLCKNFLIRFLSSQGKSEIEGKTKSTSQPKLALFRIEELEIPLPPLSEQKRIAAILDKADAIRRKRQQANQLADDFLRAVFLDMFGDPVTNPKGWDVDSFGNVFDVRDGTHDSPTYVESGFPLITSKNIKNGEIDMSDTNYISKVDYELINRRSKVDVGDILMPMIGTIGNPAVVHDEPNFAIKNVALIKLRNSGLPADFVLALLNSSLLDVAVQQKSRGGTQKFLGLGDIRNLNCYLPDERLVSKYICIANKVRQFASAYRKSNEVGLYSSLSQKAFRGEL